MASLDRTTPAASRRYWPIWQLTLTRLREFTRQPAAIFWVYGFPILMMMSLGIAFRDNQQEQIAVDLVEAEVESPKSKVQGREDQASRAPSRNEGRGSRQSDVADANPKSAISPSLPQLQAQLAADSRFKVTILPHEDWKKRLQAGKTDLVVELHPADSSAPFQLWDEPRRAESRLARYAVEAALLRSAGQQSFAPDVNHLQQAGSRYIDFLLPGMIGMGLMGGGLWGVGFVVVDMRVRKLLKRFLATPMRRSDFLLAVMLSRLVFTLGDIIVLLLFGYLAFGVRCQGSYWELTGVVLLGGTAFAGIGLLVASRAQTLETISGLMNLIMLPMWVLSGVFFSSERFPVAAQPLINLLPLTALNQALRGIMLEGKSLLAVWPQVALLASYAAGTFAVALRIFRWR